MDDVNRIRVPRRFLEEKLEEPYLERAIKGCFVRYLIGAYQGEAVYRMCEVIKMQQQQRSSSSSSRSSSSSSSNNKWPRAWEGMLLGRGEVQALGEGECRRERAWYLPRAQIPPEGLCTSCRGVHCRGEDRRSLTRNPAPAPALASSPPPSVLPPSLASRCGASKRRPGPTGFRVPTRARPPSCSRWEGPEGLLVWKTPGSASPPGNRSC